MKERNWIGLDPCLYRYPPEDIPMSEGHGIAKNSGKSHRLIRLRYHKQSLELSDCWELKEKANWKRRAHREEAAKLVYKMFRNYACLRKTKKSNRKQHVANSTRQKLVHFRCLVNTLGFPLKSKNGHTFFSGLRNSLWA